MNNKLLFPDFENIIVAGEIPTAIEDGYSYLEQVMALRKYVLSLGDYTKDLTDSVNNNTDDITKLKAFKHITHLGTETNNTFKLEELKDDLYYADTHISIEYKKGFLFHYEKGSLITKTSQSIDKPETGVVHRIMGYGDNIFAFGYNVVVNGEITDSDVSTGSLTEILSKINKNANDISNLNTMVTANTNAITSINNILNNSSQIENLTESANLWNLNNGIYKATKNLEITISSDASVSKEPITTGQIIMIQSSNDDEWEMWYTVGTNIMYSQTYLEEGVYTGSRQSINVRTISSKVEDLESRVTNLEQAPKDESIFIQFNEGTDTIIPKLQVFVDNFRKGIVTPIYWYYTSGDLIQLSKIVNGLDNTAGRRMNLYFTAFDSATLSNKQIPVGNMLINVDYNTYNITNVTKNWEYQTLESGSELPVASATTLGGVKIGDGIDVTSDGTISTTKTYFIDYDDIDTDMLTEIRTRIENDKPFYAIASGMNGKFICTGYDYDRLVFTSFGTYDNNLNKLFISLGNGEYNFEQFSVDEINKKVILEYNLTSSDAIKNAINLITSSHVFDENQTQSYNLLFRFDTDLSTSKYGIPLCKYSVPVLYGSEFNYEFAMIEDTTLYIARLTQHYENETTTYTYQKLTFPLNGNTGSKTYIVDASTTTDTQNTVFQKWLDDYNSSGNTNIYIKRSGVLYFLKDIDLSSLPNLTLKFYQNQIAARSGNYGTYFYRFVYCPIELNITDGTITSTSGIYFQQADYPAYVSSSVALPINNGQSYTPTSDYHPATKKYVDDKVSSINVSPKKFSFDFLFSDDATDSVSSYNSSSYIMTGISKSFDVNEIYGELMVKYSEVISGTTYSSVCPADRLKYMLTNVSDVDYSFRTLSDGTSQLTLFIRRTDETQPFISPTNIKIENIFINGYFLNSTEDISKSTTITKN